MPLSAAVVSAVGGVGGVGQHERGAPFVVQGVGGVGGGQHGRGAPLCFFLSLQLINHEGGSGQGVTPMASMV